jgi:hypothetical protein
MTVILNRRYILHEALGSGGMGIVYRATDRLNGQTVALKQVKTAPEALSFASKADGHTSLHLALAGEFRTLSSLRHPNIISVLDYGFDAARQPYYTMEYLPNAQTLIDAGKGGTRLDHLHLIVQMLQALVYLHRRGILHRDLKPGNVMITQGQVKVVDFGLSITTKSPSVKHVTQTTAGTLAYMAPELFQGEPVSRASDLYAVGVMAYELFAGRHPFNVNNLAMLVNETLNKPADVRSIGLDEPLADVLERLLAKTEQDRYSDVGDVIRDLCQAADLPLPPETVAIRESFLQAAKFVGRDIEFSQLADALDEALAGHGSTHLVGGESGVGKSRLLDELRTLALVKGALVLRGQAVSEGGSTYHMWRDVLRWLSILTDLNDEEASILKALVPDLSDLLDRPIADAPVLDAQLTQKRLFVLTTELFRRQAQPLVVILEDLQWAGSESLAFLNHLKTQAVSLSLLLIGNYRDDERPHLPEEIPDTNVLKLHRFSKAAIRELSVSMLGSMGKEPHVVELLERETEGNVFFVVEVVRALTEDSGHLDEIGRRTLPERIFAGGIQEVVQRRLRQVPENDYPLLRLAATAGRDLDLKVLQALDGDMDLITWLGICSNAAVLEMQGDRWRFTHDKLREHLLYDMQEADRIRNHRHVAEAIEITYPDHLEQSAALAYLWHIARHDDKELHYSELAGRQELKNNAYAEGISFLHRALELLLKHDETRTRAEHELRLRLLLGPAMMNYYGYSHPIIGEMYIQMARLGRETNQVNAAFSALWGLWSNSAISAKYSSANMIVKEMFETANQTGEALHLLEAHHVGWSTAIWQGATRVAEDYFKNGMPLYNRDMHHACISMHGHDTGTCGWALGSLNLWLFGYPDRALERSQDAYARAFSQDQIFSQGYGFFARAVMGFLTRDMAQQARWAEEFLNYSFKHDFKFFMTLSGFMYSSYLARNGHFEQAIHQIITTNEVMYQAKTFNARSLVINTFMEVYLIAGQIDEGINVFREELAEHPMMGERIMEPEIRRLYGELLLRQNQLQQAEQEFQLALTIARKQEAKSLELRAGMSLARLWRAQGKTQDAHQILSDIYTWFTEGFDTADLQEASALLRG